MLLDKSIEYIFDAFLSQFDGKLTDVQDFILHVPVFEYKIVSVTVYNTLTW